MSKPEVYGLNSNHVLNIKKKENSMGCDCCTNRGSKSPLRKGKSANITRVDPEYYYIDYKNANSVLENFAEACKKRQRVSFVPTSC